MKPLPVETPPPFNRTSLELKQQYPYYFLKAVLPFNRTSLELKPLNPIFLYPAYFLLIEPVWN